MNNVNLVGRLAKDPIARDGRDTRITEITLVTDRPRNYVEGQPAFEGRP
ncbi:hypothetical protein [Croceibacterium ferulae]|nr:hypothetical protein [Croceibacterium ferulae]